MKNKLIQISQFTEKISRRKLLGGAATAAVAIVQTANGQTIQKAIPQAALADDDPTKKMGIPPGEIGTRSSFEKLLKDPSATSSRSPLQDILQ